MMSVDMIKEHLHLRIEQADPRLLGVLAELTESLFKTYQPDTLEAGREQRIAAYEAGLRPMTKEQLIARALASQEDIEAGRLHDVEEVEKVLGL